MAAELCFPMELLGWSQAFQPIHRLLLIGLLAALYLAMTKRRPHTAYLVDYACFKGSPTCRVPMSTFIEHMNLTPFVEGRSIRFMTRVLERSGIGDESNLPPSVSYIPVYRSLKEARAEAEWVVFSAIDDLFAKTGVTPDTVGILVVNCSIFAPVPCISDMIVGRYNLRDDIRAVNLSGMGCSAGVTAVALATRLLQATRPQQHGAHYALVVSTETLTSNYYVGKERPMQLSNVLFRIGGAAVLLSTSKEKARFRLTHLVRTITGAASDAAYSCIFQEEDAEGELGMNLSKDLPTVAADALKANITAMGPLVLPLTEQLRFAVLAVMSSISRKLPINGRRVLRPSVPDFRKAFDHFCIHTGGPTAIDGVQRVLGLSDQHVEPPRMTLHRFGNTSSSSVWYELAYVEAKGRMSKADRIWMIGFGSGFECVSAAWECIRPAEQTDKAWAECIRRYPVGAHYRARLAETIEC
ncbi:3-ketoacyl-CoA synthase 5 [Hordeum vulgare]|nr:3-ketoacyl-CoA synthase 5 [Hordeum vulgare]